MLIFLNTFNNNSVFLRTRQFTLEKQKEKEKHTKMGEI